MPSPDRPAADVPLTPAQRRFLRGQAAVCAAIAALTGLAALCLLGVGVDQLAQGPNLLPLLLTLIPAAFCAAMVVFSLQFWRDLRAGVARRSADRLDQLSRSNGVIRALVFARIGTLQPAVQDGVRCDLDAAAVGAVLEVLYSPHSRTLWALGPAPRHRR